MASCCPSFLAAINSVCKQVLSVSKFGNKARVQLPDSFRQDIRLFFIPSRSFFPTCCLDERWPFICFKRQQGSILGRILKMIFSLAGSFLLSELRVSSQFLTLCALSPNPSRAGFSIFYPASRHKGKCRAVISNAHIAGPSPQNPPQITCNMPSTRRFFHVHGLQLKGMFSAAR